MTWCQRHRSGGGSIRISDPQLQQRMFTALGLDEANPAERFGLLEAFQYGVPHGGLPLAWTAW